MLTLPQIERAPRGGSDVWDDGLAGQLLLGEFFEDEAPPPPTPPPPPVEQASGGWPLWDLQPRRKKREDWQKAFDELMAKPAPAVVVEALAAPQGVKDSFTTVAPKLTATQQAYIDGVFAAIVRAKNEQERARKLAEIAKAEGEALQAQILLAQAVEAERVAKQQMMDFDLAFVAAVLIEA